MLIGLGKRWEQLTKVAWMPTLMHSHMHACSFDQLSYMTYVTYQLCFLSLIILDPYLHNPHVWIVHYPSPLISTNTTQVPNESNVQNNPQFNHIGKLCYDFVDHNTSIYLTKLSTLNLHHVVNNIVAKKRITALK